MILERMTEEEFERYTKLIEPQILNVKEQTGLQSKFIREVLTVSTHLLAREQDMVPVSLDRFITRHCHRIASDLGANQYDVRDVIEAWVIYLCSHQPGEEESSS